MLFNSLEFVFFLPVVVILYFLIPHKFRWILLLAASYYFYMSWKVEYIILIVASTLVDYISARQIERNEKRSVRRLFLVLSLITNLGLLFSFKYFNFFSGSLNLVFDKFNLFQHIPELNVLLPVGISFYTFQTLSYTIDVYFRRVKAEKHLGYFALYVSYFPQLVAGPIERYDRLSPQLKAKHNLSYTNLVNGLRLILYGLFIKMVIADNLSGYVDQIYKSPDLYNSWSILTGVLFYSFQIYSDFYGYSIIAIGSALIMGVRIMDNFKTPYLSKSINEFWQRWHISLSTWFRDYLYIPLGGNRVAKYRWVLNIMIVFTVSGLWHGANWTFIIWGAMYGLFYLLESGFNRMVYKPKVKHKFSLTHILLAFKTFVFVTIIWVFFRSQNFLEAVDIFKSIFQNFNLTDEYVVETRIWILLLIFILSDVVLYNSRFDEWSAKLPILLRWAVYSFLIFAIIVFAGVENFPFIYFQF